MKKIKKLFFFIIIFLFLIFIIYGKKYKLSEDKSKNINLSSKLNNEIQISYLLNKLDVLNCSSSTVNIGNIIINHEGYVFKGTIGNQKILMSVSRNNNQLIVSYTELDMEKSEIHLKGLVDLNKPYFVLHDEKNMNSYFFVLNDEYKLNGIIFSSLNKSMIGTQISLSYFHSMGVNLEKRYSQINSNITDVEKFAKRIKYDILNDKKEDLSEIILYPIKVNIKGKKILIDNKDEFIKNYTKIINSQFRNGIKNSSTKYLFSNYEGVQFSFENGSIWFSNFSDYNLKIYGINN